MTTQEINASRLEGLMPELATRLRSALITFEARNLHVLICQGLRTVAEQDALFFKGRNKNGKIIDKKSVVTNARGGHSYHNFGLAVDVVPLTAIGKADWVVNKGDDWEPMIDILKSHNLEWGGSWQGLKGDLGHFQLSGGHSISEIRTIFSAREGQAAFDAVWQLVRSGLQ
jgi:peptidoglycan L-alanyl-D-glutamate endopeptidase CwlK